VDKPIRITNLVLAKRAGLEYESKLAADVAIKWQERERIISEQLVLLDAEAQFKREDATAAARKVEALQKASTNAEKAGDVQAVKEHQAAAAEYAGII
jgi:hypothetical protein